MDNMKQAPKRYGMGYADFNAGYECCEMEKPNEMTGIDGDMSGGEKEQKFGGFLTRNNTWDRI